MDPESNANRFPRVDAPFMRSRGMALLLLALLTIGVFSNGLDGQFVYDDTRQIVANPYIQDATLIAKALSSDVWVFKGDSDQAGPSSNYWRPVFVGYLALNYALFGADSTLGWHLSNLILHLAVVLLCFGLLRRLGMGFQAAWWISALFAVHPAHVESVTWVSGAPDPLTAVFMLAAWLLLTDRQHGVRLRPVPTVFACLLFGLALLSKEIALALAPLVLAHGFLWLPSGKAGLKARAWRALGVSAPLWLVAVVWFGVRSTIVEPFGTSVSWELAPLELIANVPHLVLFYFGQALAPVSLSPSYPLRALSGDELTVAAVALPSLIIALPIALGAWLARERRVYLLGLLVFLLPLLPALNINAYLPEQIVHDRYLYLPLLGLLMMLYAAFAGVLGRIGQSWPAGSLAGRVRSLGLVLIALLLSIQTWRYADVWSDEISLWRRGVEVDPGSAFNWSQLGIYLQREGRNTAAERALDRSLEIQPNAPALVARADLYRATGRPDRAARDLRRVLAYQPNNIEAAERLAVLLQSSGQLAAAQQVLERTLSSGPARRCSLVTNLAVLRYLQGDSGGAADLLEQATRLAVADSQLSCQVAWLHLGRLRQEQGDNHAARWALGRFIDAVADMPAAAPQREQALTLLESLGR